MMIPEIFQDALLRVVTPATETHIGIAFDHAGKTTRLKLSLDDALQLAALINSHSEVCSGIPSRDVSSSAPVSA